MQHRSLPVAGTFAAAAALLLSACGSGDESGSAGPASGDEAARTDHGGRSTASPRGANPTLRPTFTFPRDLSDKFENWRSGDATKDAVLADVGRRVDATNYAIAEGNAKLPALALYYDGTALTEARDWVTSLAKDGYSITGVNRYYNAKVELFDPTSASVVYCEDQSKAFAKDRKSNKIYKTDVTDKAYVRYSTRLEKNDQGVWRTTKLTSLRGHDSCVP